MEWLVPNEFLNEEMRSGHLVTKDVKELWLVELGCLKVLDDLCKKHDIVYYAGGGTLLGAIRHKGFIPWDDDIDVFMDYANYLRFCSIAPQELKDPFFFQNYMTENGFGPGFSRIRNSETTGCTQYDYSMASPDYNCGIFIDIFPLFGVERNKFRALFQRYRIGFWRRGFIGYEIQRIFRNGGNESSVKFNKHVIVWRILSIIFDHKSISQRFLKACSSAKKYDKIGLLSFSGLNQRFIWDKAWFEETTILPFEFTEIPCPKAFDPVLRTMYGDYNIFVKGGQIHTMTVCDTKTPFRIKLQEKFKSHL